MGARSRGNVPRLRDGRRFVDDQPQHQGQESLGKTSCDTNRQYEDGAEDDDFHFIVMYRQARQPLQRGAPASVYPGVKRVQRCV